MQYTGSALCIRLVSLAWVACVAYFVFASFRTNRIQQRESRPLRIWDYLFLWGGYAVLFYQTNGASPWNRAFVPSAWAVPAGWLGTVLVMAGLGYTLWARVTLGRFWSRAVAVKQEHKLVTKGPYQRVRHPLYLGLLVAAAGTVLAFGLWRVIPGVVILWIGFSSRARREDALMAQRFGVEFETYRAGSGGLFPAVLPNR